MRLLSNYQQFKLFRQRQFLLDPIDKKQPRKYGYLTILSPERTDIAKVLNMKLFSKRYLKSIYTDKITRMKLITGAMVTKRQKVNDTHKLFKEEMPWIANTFLTPKQYQDKNIIFDASPQLGVLTRDNFAAIGMYIRQCYKVFDSMLMDTRFANYKKKYFVVNIDESIKVDMRYLIKMNLKTPVQVFFYRLFNDINTMVDWIGTTIIITNDTGMFTYFDVTPELISDGINRIIFRFMKGMWAYAAANAEGILEIDDAVEKDEEIPVREDPPTEQKLTKIAAKLQTNKALSKEPLKNALVDINQPKGKLFDEKIEDDPLSDALGALKTISKDINKTAATQVKPEKKYSSIRKKAVDEDDVDETIDKIDEEIEKPNHPYDSDPVEDDEELGEGDFNSDDTSDKEADEIYEQAINTARASRLPSRTPAVTKRIKLLKTRSEKIRMSGSEGKTLKELVDDFDNTALDVEESPAPNVANKSVKYATGQALARSYYTKQFDKDIAMLMKQFAEAPEISMVVTDITKKDVSDTLNGIIKYTFKFEDEFGKKHVVSYNIPKLIDNKFFLINGNKKMLTGQITPIPVVKIHPDAVRIATSYNQMEIHRFGRSFDPKIDILKKLLNNFAGNGTFGVTYTVGDSSNINLRYETTLEYDKISETFYSIVIESEDKKKSISFVFNQHDIRIMFEDLNIAYVEKTGYMPIGITESKEIIHIDTATGKEVKTKKLTICDLIISAIKQYSTKETLPKILNKISVPKKYMYSRCHYIDRQLSLGVLLAYLYGFKELLKEMGVKYRLEKEPIAAEDKYSQNVIQFKDVYLYYDIHPARHAMILNGIATEMETTLYTFDEMDGEAPYLLTFDSLYQTRQVAKGFKDCKAWLIDFASAQVMRTLELPDTFLPIMLYANMLLEDNSQVDIKATPINRIRNVELIPCVFMYKSLVTNYIKYKYRYTKTGNIHIHENDIIDRLNDSGLFRDYDTLNPIREIETEGSLTFKGPGGFKMSDAYSLSMRAFDKSMVGVFAASSPDSADVGISKFLPLNPRITDVRGFVKSGETDNPEELDYGNIGSVAELLVPFAIDHDDAKRLGLVGKESKHLMAASETDPMLIGNGVEKVLPYMTSNDFISVAKQSGKVLVVDKDNGIAVVEYKDGTRETIDIQDREHKDGGMGFYVVSRKIFEFKEGDTFKKNDVLARNPSYFSTENSVSKPEFNPGVLSNVAIIMSPYTFEDSSIITERIAGRMSTEVVMFKAVVLGAKSQIHSIASVGSHVNAGDALMVYEDEIDDPEINKMVSESDAAKDLTAIEELVNRTPHSKVTGTIHDIKIYYTVPTTEMSESVKKLVDWHNNRIKQRKKIMNEYNAPPPGEIVTDYIGITKPNASKKIRGEVCPTGRILIEIYVKYRDTPNSGDKVTYFSSLKCVLARTIPQSLAPYPVKRPHDPIDAVLSPISLEARMVASVLYVLFGNKCVWGLKEKIRKIYNKYAKNEQSLPPSSTVTEDGSYPDVLQGLTDENISDLNLVQTFKTMGYSTTEIVQLLQDQ
jgi:hypothetical protein